MRTLGLPRPARVVGSWLALGIGALACASAPVPLQLADVVAPASAGASSPPVASVEPAAEGPAPAAAAQPEDGRDPSLDDVKVCAPPDRGWGRYLPYRKVHKGRLSLPDLEGQGGRESFDVFIHFHFHDAVRRVFVHEGYPMLFAGVDLGEGSRKYTDAFHEADSFRKLLADIEGELREHAGARAKLGRVYLSSWSAGFGATTRIARLFPDRVAGLVLLDSLYAPHERDESGEVKKGTVFAPPLAPVVDMARKAMKGERLLFLTYSHTETIGYASTGEVASYLLKKIGIRETAVASGVDPRGQITAVDEEGLHLRGFLGNDAKAHCNHLRYAAQAVRLIRASRE